MELQLIDGKFDPQEAIALLRELVDVKIKFHEKKIAASMSEEDIKFREQRIKALQTAARDMTVALREQSGSVRIHTHFGFDA